MPPGSRLQSYAPHVVKGKMIFFIFLASFLAVYKGQLASASTPSLASSVNLQTWSAVSPSGGVSPTQTSVRASSTASTSPPRTFEISIQLSQTPWHEDLYNKQSPMFVALATNLTTAVTDALKTVGDARVEVVEFKPGSVIAVLNVTTLSSNEMDMKTKLTDEMKDGQLGGFSVDPTVYSGTLFDVVLRVVYACNSSLADKGFDQKENFETAMSKEMSANPEFLGASIQRIDCSTTGNITIVTARVQIGGPSASSPYKELNALKGQVDAGQVGNFTVVPEWKSYTPGEKVFYVRVTLKTESADTAQTRKQLEQFVESEFKSEDNFRYVQASTPDSKTAIIEIGMASSTSEFLSVALSPLAADLNRAKLGNVTVVKTENRVTIDTRSLTRKTFEVTFVQYVSSCVSDSNDPHYKNLSQGFWRYIDEKLKASKINEVYVESKVTNIKCQNSTTLRGYAYIYLKPTAQDDIEQFLRPFYKCKEQLNIYNAGIRITLKTPTKPNTEGRWSYVLGGVSITYVCPKPKPPTKPPIISTATTPTPQATSSPSPTTEASLSSTGKTTDKPVNATEHTLPPETTTRPTTRVILPTLAVEPELYVKLKLGLTWGEFCSKRDALKERIAWNVRDSNDIRVSPDRIVYINVEQNCAEPGKKDELAEVLFYVSESGSKEVLDKELTLKAYELFKMFFENGNTKQLGPDFQEKVVQVELAGNDASNCEKETNSSMASWMIILLAVAGAVGLFLMLLACCSLFCCGVRRRRRSGKYGTEHPQTLYVVHVDSNDPASGGTKEKELKNSTEKDIRKAEEHDGKNLKEDGGKDGFKNGGYESDDKNKSQTTVNTTDEKGNSDQGDKSPARISKVLSDQFSNAYGSLNKADGHGEHTYASLNKAGSEKNSNGGGNNNNNTGYIAMTAPLSNGGIGRSGDRSAGEVRKSKDSRSSDVISARAGKGGESPNSGSQPKGASIIKPDPGPKGGERRGSNVYYASIDDDVPLTHKTGTVGIVALAIRNKNETKKESEFKNLDKDLPNEVVKYPPEAATKTRSPDALPTPRTRVKLSTSPDYINANWIRNHKGQVSYIATQHPLRETTEDFWRMVWDQKALTVVMVNNEENENPAEFVDYLPKGQGNTKQFGGINVTVKQITKKADYVLTILSIVEAKNAASSREVSHMRFTSWKERAMPNVALFVAFVTATREARKKHGDTKAPTIVHCSDGLGFSGVYIAVDIGIKSNEESKTSVVDVFELSKNLRRDRHGIVCTLEHYNFIYQALYEYTVNYNESVE